MSDVAILNATLDAMLVIRPITVIDPGPAHKTWCQCPHGRFCEQCLEAMFWESYRTMDRRRRQPLSNVERITYDRVMIEKKQEFVTVRMAEMRGLDYVPPGLPPQPADYSSSTQPTPTEPSTMPAAAPWGSAYHPPAEHNTRALGATAVLMSYAVDQLNELVPETNPPTTTTEQEAAMAVTKKHMNAVAEAMRAVRPDMGTDQEKATWREQVLKLSHHFAKENERFSRDRFLSACGFIELEAPF